MSILIQWFVSWRCPKCGTKNAINRSACTNCGHKFGYGI